MRLRIIKLFFLFLPGPGLEGGNLLCQKNSGICRTLRRPIKIAVNEDVSECVRNLLGQLGIGMSKLDLDEIGCLDRFNLFACDNCIFVRLELGYFLRAQLRFFAFVDQR